MPRFEHHRRFLELEVEGDALVRIEGSLPDSRGSRSGGDDVPESGGASTRTFDTADDARHAASRLIVAYRRRGYKLVGPSRHLGDGQAAAPRSSPASWVALDAYFVAGDPQFLSEILRATASAKLAAFAERWYRDTRPWARQALRDYIDDGCDRPLHKGLVKRLFKLAETASDDELMTHFLVAFDRLSRRFLVKEMKYAGWDPRTQQADVREVMHLAQDASIPTRLPAHARDQGPSQGKPPPGRSAGGKLAADDHPVFTKVTRRYLARRAYRYFRTIAHKDISRYGRAMRLALPRYTEASLSTPARLLDAWGLMHALYARSPVIVRAPTGIRLADGKSLGELAPAPHFDAAWDGAAELFTLATDAASRTVRAWAVAMLRSRHAAALADLDFATVKRLLASPHDELAGLGAELFARGSSAWKLETLPLAEWLALLAIPNLDVLPAIAAVAERVLSPARLSLAQCIELACGKTASTARLGLAWARTKPITADDDLRAITRLARAGVAGVRDEGTAWALAVIAAHPAARPEQLRDLCDAPYTDARARALAVAAGTERFAAEPALWFALTESPYPDVRAVVLAHAARWRDQAPAATLRHVWTTAILSIHGGGKAKAAVPRAIADRIAARPDEAIVLLPVLGHALRSVRPAERALALGALARAARSTPGLAALAHQVLPELTLSGQVSS